MTSHTTRGRGLAPGAGTRAVLGAAAASQPPQQPQFAIEQHACLRAVDLPAPRICQIERAADLPGTAVRHVPEPPGIAAMATSAFGEVEHDAAGCALDLIGGLGAIRPELCDHRAQGTNQIQRDVPCGGRNWIVDLDEDVDVDLTPMPLG